MALSNMNKTDFDAYAIFKSEFLMKVRDEMVPVTAVVREPFEIEDNRWLCPVGISGLIHRKADLLGNSPAEAVAAGKQFLREELARIVDDTGDLRTLDQQPVSKPHKLFRD